jgi:alpha-D-xyloside xylohydrolase
VGHSPMLPGWGAGYWHSKNRYSTQQEITDAAAGFASRGINVSVIVIDYNHWPRMVALCSHNLALGWR